MFVDRRDCTTGVVRRLSAGRNTYPDDHRISDNYPLSNSNVNVNSGSNGKRHLNPNAYPNTDRHSYPTSPRTHTLESGQTLIGLAIFYGITLDSIFDLNGFNNNTSYFAGQEILIPWPTPTPPLQALSIDIGESQVIVDPSNCPPFYTIQEGDSLFFLAAQNDVPLDVLLTLNYLTIDSIVQPGDAICIPNVVEGGFLPPTPGPSPTPSVTPPPAGPQLLFPVNGADNPNALQWLAVKSLQEDEWYMVEILDLSDVTAYPRRGFTRSTSFQLPNDWRPSDGQPHRFEWQVSIVRVTGVREDGSFIYTYGGRESEIRTFIWQ